MFLPILFVIGLAYVGVQLGRKLRPSDFHIGAVVARPQLHQASYVREVARRVGQGIPVTPWLLCEATREAFDSGDWATVRQLSEIFDPPIALKKPAPQKQKESDEPTETNHTSPLDGISDEDWQSFCVALESKSPGFKSDRYVGRYEQNQKRLRQLGIETPTPADEYKALVIDMQSYWDGESKLIAEASGEVIFLNGQEHPVTPSGVLGLLKAAGPQGARSWLENETDRGNFPHTTETFKRTNGCF